MTIIGSFRAWGWVLCPPAKPAAYRLQNINFERSFGNLIKFAFSKTKQEVSRPGNVHFWKFCSLRKGIMPSGKAYGLQFAKYQFWTTFRELKKFSYRKTKREVSRPGSDNFWTFRAWGSVLCPPAKPSTYCLQNIDFERRFGNLNKFPSVKLSGRSPAREVTIIGSFRAWGSVLYPPAKPTAYRLQNINFERRFDNLKFFYRKLNVWSPGREITIFGRFGDWGSVLVLRHSQRLTVYKISIWTTFR